MSKKWGVKMEIKINSISVVIKGKRIFSNITDTMNSGDMVALTGSSGCGKTTLLNCLGLIQPIESGSILINGNDTSKWNDKDKTKFWHKYATFIYQDYGIIEDETVAYNITLDKSKAKSKAVKNILDLNCKMKLELRNWDKGACPFIPIRAAAGPLFSFFV